MLESTNLSTQLDLAAANKQWDIICTAISQGELAINHQFANGNTLLHLLALDSANLKDLCWLLMQPGIDLNILNQQQLSPIYNAISHGGFAVLELLLKYQLSLGSSISPLAYCLLYSKQDRAAIIEILLQQDLDTNLTAVKNQININEQFTNGRTLLHFAIYYKKISLFNWLLEQDDLLIDTTDNFGRTALFDAIRYARLAIVEELIQAGANYCSLNKHAITPLYWACMHADGDIISYLLKQPDINTIALVSVQQAVQDDCLKQNINFKHTSLLTILLHAGQQQIVTWLLENNFYVDDSTENKPELLEGDSLSEEEINKGLNIFYSALAKAKHADAKDYYDLELLQLDKWPANSLAKFLQVNFTLIEYAVKQGTEQSCSAIKQYLEDAILYILPRAPKLEQIRFYSKIAEVFLAQWEPDTAIHCYATALNTLGQLDNIEEDIKDELSSEIRYKLQAIETKLLYKYSLPIITAQLNIFKTTNDYEAIYKQWQGLKTLWIRLKVYAEEEYKELFIKFARSLELYAQDFLITDVNELENRANSLLQDANNLLSYNDESYNTIVRAWIKTVFSLQLPAAIKDKWIKLRHECFNIAPVANNLNAISWQYRLELKKLRDKFEDGLKLNKPIIERQQAFTKGVILMLNDLAAQISSWLGESPCAYSWLGIGSIARHSLAPYSDLDCAILIADEACKTHPYFTSWILSIDAVLKTMAEPWVYINKTPICRGLHIDVGDLQRIIFNPENNHQDQQQKQLLINTPEKLAELVINAGLNNAITEHTEQTLAFSLLMPCLLYNPNLNANSLLGQYQQLINIELEKPNLALSFWDGIIGYNLKSIDGLQTTVTGNIEKTLNIKTKYINPLVHLCTMAAAYYKNFTKQQSLSAILKTLANYWHSDYIRELQTSLAYLYRLRAAQHFTQQAQSDEIACVPEQWKQLELASLTLWQCLIDLNYIFEPDLNFHPLTTYAKLLENDLDVGSIATKNPSLLGIACKLLTQLPQQDLYRIYLKLPNNYRLLIVQAMQEYNFEPYLIHLYASLPNKIGVSLSKEQELQDWQNILLKFTDEYKLPQKANYIKANRLKVEFVILKDGKFKKETRLFPRHYSINGKRYNYCHKNGKFNIKQLKQNNLWLQGDRSHILKLIQDNTLIAYAKIYPELPGVQLQADTLSQRLNGVNFHSTLAKVTPLSGGQKILPLLFSQVVPETLQEYLNQGKNLTEIEQQLDPFYFSLKLLETLVMSPEDDKPDNIGLCKLANNRYRLISFDADHAFYPAIVERTTIAGKERKVQLKSMVLCFLHMQNAIHPEAKSLFLSFSPYELLQDFLLELDANYQQELFTPTEIQEFLTYKYWLANAFEVGTVAKLYEQIRRIQAALQDKTIITHFDLLIRIEPLVSDYYLKLYQNQYTSPEERWDALRPDTEYKLVTDQAGHVICKSGLTTTTRAKRSLTVVKERQDRKETNRPKFALVELESIYNQSLQINNLISQLLQGETKDFIASFPFIQEQIIKRLDFSQINSPINKAIETLQNLYELHLQNSSLNYTDLITILANQPKLRVLNLSGCTNIKDDLRGMGWALSYVTHLEYLNLSNTNIKTLANNVPFSNFSLLKLKRLILQNCPLSDLNLTSPNLECLQIQNCNLLSVPIETLSYAYPRLSRLELINNLNLNLKGIAQVSWPQLKELSLTLVNQENNEELSNYLPSMRQNLPKLKQLSLQKYGLVTKNLIEYQDSVYCLAELGNGNLAIGSGDNTLRIWNTTDYTCISTLTGHHGGVLCLAELRSGSLASGSYDNTIRIWDTTNYSCITTLTEHAYVVCCLAELRSGSLASGSWDNTIRIWDTTNYSCITALTGHQGGVLCLAELRSGSLASGSYDNTIRIWDTANYSCIATLTGHQNSVYCLAELRNGSLASGSEDRTIKIWDTASNTCIATLTGHKGLVRCLAELRNDSLASGSRDNTIRIWDTTNYSCTATLTGHQRPVYCLAELGSGSLASGSGDNMRIWDRSRISLEFGLWQEIELMEINNLSLKLHTASLAASNNLKACAEFLGKVELLNNEHFNFNTEDSLARFLLTVLGGEMTSSSRLILNLNLRNLDSLTIKNSNLVQELIGDFTGTNLNLQNCSYLKSLTITSHNLEHLKINNCSLLEEELISKLLQSNPRLISLHLINNLSFNLKDISQTIYPQLTQMSLTVNQESYYEISNYLPRVQQYLPRLKQLNLQKYGLVAKNLTEHHGIVFCLVELGGGSLASGSGDNTIRIWNTTDYTCIATLTGHQGGVLCLAELRNSNLASGSYDNTIRIWDTTNYICIATLTGHNGTVLCLAELRSGRLASGSWDNTIRIWDTANYSCITTLTGHQRAVYCLAELRSDSLASGSEGGTIKIWDTANYSCIAALTGHKVLVRCLAELRNGSLASGSEGGTIKIWDTASNTCIATLTGHQDCVRCFAELRNDKLASGALDKTIRIWNTTNYSCTATLTGHQRAVYCLAELGSSRLASGSYDKTIKIWDFSILNLEFELWQELELIEINDLNVLWNTSNTTASKSLIELALFMGDIKAIDEQQIVCRGVSRLQEFLLTAFGGEVNVSGLMELNLKMPYLRTLIIKNNLSIKRITGDFTALEHLDIFEAGNISDLCIFNILRSAVNLQQININYNPIFRFFSLASRDLNQQIFNLLDSNDLKSFSCVSKICYLLKQEAESLVNTDEEASDENTVAILENTATATASTHNLYLLHSYQSARENNESLLDLSKADTKTNSSDEESEYSKRRAGKQEIKYKQ